MLYLCNLCLLAVEWIFNIIFKCQAVLLLTVQCTAIISTNCPLSFLPFLFSSLLFSRHQSAERQCEHGFNTFQEKSHHQWSYPTVNPACLTQNCLETSALCAHVLFSLVLFSSDINLKQDIFYVAVTLTCQCCLSFTAHNSMTLFFSWLKYSEKNYKKKTQAIDIRVWRLSV